MAAIEGMAAEYLTFLLAGEEYAIDILQVQEIRAYEAVTRIHGADAFVKGVINLRGTIVPIVDLRVRFSLPEAAAPVVIILNIARQVIGVVVDAVCDVVALPAAGVRPAPDLGSVVAAGFIRGIAPIGSRMLIVVDIARLMTGDELSLLGRQTAIAA